MSAALLMVMRVLVGGFYRRHLVFLGLLGLFLIGLVHPPYLLFSGIFIRSVLLSTALTCALAGLSAVWAVYAGVRLLRDLCAPELAFLLPLGVLPAWHLRLVALAAALGSGFLGYLYLGLMAFHAFETGNPAAPILSLLPLCIGVLATLALAARMARPRGIISPRRWIPMLRLGYGRILWEYLWREHGSTIWIVKGFSLLFVALILQTGYDRALPQIISLAFIVSALFQSAVPFRLRQSEERHLAWFRSLPLPAWRRVCHYVVVYAILQIPELLLLVLAAVSQETSMLLPIEYAVVVFSLHLLSLGLSYLPQMTTQDFVRLQFAQFMVLFMGLIFAVPLVAVYPVLAVVGGALCVWGMFRGDGSLEA